MSAGAQPQLHPRSAREPYAAVVARLAAAQKSNRGAPAYSRFVNRPLGRRFAAAAYRAGLTPDTVTVLSALASFAGIAVVALVSPSPVVGATVAALLVLGYGLDAADGQLARLRGGGSPAGEWLDHMVDCAKISSLHLAVAVSTFRFSDRSEVWLLVPLAFAVVASVSFFAQILNEQLRRAHGVEAARAARPSSALRSLAAAPTDYGLLCVAFVLLGGPAFLPVYAVLLAGSAGYLALALVAWRREVLALGGRS